MSFVHLASQSIHLKCTIVSYGGGNVFECCMVLKDLKLRVVRWVLSDCIRQKYRRCEVQTRMKIIHAKSCEGVVSERFTTPCMAR